MSLIALGINHKTASVTLREKFAFDAARLSQAFSDAAQRYQLHNLVILSTCNRTEIYALAQSSDTLVSWLSEFCHIEPARLTQHHYIHTGNDALTHMIRVASGLDSMILGEPQILGQLKQALTSANAHDMVNKQFNWLFEHIFAATKKVRSESKVGEQAVSLGFAVAKLASQIFDDIHDNTLLLVAAGEMNQLVARHLCRSGVTHVIICNRSPERAHTLAEQLHRDFNVVTETAGLDELDRLLERSDIVSSCTGSLDVLITHKMVKRANKKRRYKPMLMVDLAVPRDIDDAVAKIDNVYHYAIDDLQHVIDGNLEQRREASVHAEVMISQLVININTRQKVKEVGKEIADFRERMRQISTNMNAKAQAQLANGKPAEAIIDELTHQLTAKLTHGQFKLLREAANQDAHILSFILTTLQDSERS